MIRLSKFSRSTARNWLATFSLAALLSAAQAQQKIAVVDMGTLFNKYYKTKQAGTQLEERRQDILKVQKGMLDDFQKAQEDFNKLDEGAKDPSISNDEKEKRRKQADTKLGEVRELETNIRKYNQQAEESFMQQKSRMKQKMIQEIRDAIEAKAKADGLSLVLDSVGVSMNEAPVVLFSNGQYDITDDILKKLNENAPAVTAKEDDKKPDPKAAAKPDAKDSKSK
jgi:outer membrane protein